MKKHELANMHLDHQIRYRGKENHPELGTVERTTIDGDVGLLFWLKGESTPILVPFDQVIDCETCHTMGPLR